MSAAAAKVAVFLLQLGGPENLDGIEPFLANLFEDVLPLPALMRAPLARAIARRRTPKVRPLYAKIGGGSPLLANTRAQAAALAANLRARGLDAEIQICMRYAPPRAAQVLAWARQHAQDRLWVALSLYPQYSFATSRSSLRELEALMDDGERQRLVGICAYPAAPGYLAAVARQVDQALAGLAEDDAEGAHLVFSAHGLPMRLVREGDPYPQHIYATVQGVLARLARPPGGWTLSYQSRVGPVKWLTPATDATLAALGRDGIRTVVVVPIAFVSEHIETLEELDLQLAEVAHRHGVERYVRVPTVGTLPGFIDALGERVEHAAARPRRCCGAFAGCERRRPAPGAS